MSDDPAAPPPAAPEPTPAPAAPARRRWSKRRAWLGAAGYLFSVLAIVAVLLGSLWWLLRNESGTAWLLARVPTLQVTGARGSLLGDFAAERLQIELPGTNAGVSLDDVSWRNLRFTSAPGALWVRLAIDELRARRVELRLGEQTDSGPLEAPSSLYVPLEIDIAALRADELLIDKLGDEPLRSLQARLHIGAMRGEQHRIDDLRLQWQQMQISGDARVATRGDLALKAHVELAQPLPDGGRWQALADLNGPLAAPQLQARLRAQPTPSRPAQSLDARAVLRPFAAWPLGELQARASALDLSALHRAAPVTALDIEASVQSQAIDQPAEVTLQLNNRQPGRWNDGRLPLRALQLALRARPDDPSQLDVQRFDAELGTLQQSAGRIVGNGRWNPSTWRLDTRLSALHPALLDARAPAMLLDGQIGAEGRGFDSTGLRSAQVELKADVRGSLTDAPARIAARQVQLTLNAGLSLLRIEIRDALARAGEAEASLQATLSRSATDAPWSAKGHLELDRFDPLPWWPGRADSPWRQGPHRINADTDFDLQLAPLGDKGAADPLAALRGDLRVELQASRLAGVPLSGSLALHSAMGLRDGPSEAKLVLDADGNRLRADARLGRLGAGADDHWDINAEMPALNRLQPLWRLLRDGAAQARLGGALSLQGQVDGRWPVLTSQGRLDASQLQIDGTQVQRATGRWNVGSRLDAPLDVQFDLEQLATDKPLAESVRLRVNGTARDHTLELRADSKALPPAWVESLQPASAGAAAKRSLALVQASGGLVGDGAQRPSGWRGKLQRIELRGDAAAAPPWVEASDVALAYDWAGPRSGLQVEPGSARVLGAALRFDRIRWRSAAAPGASAALDAQLQIEPIAVAPLLERLQPGFGWGGDLRVQGHLRVQSAPTFSADVVIERSAGDLTVSDDSGVRSMGLSDLRVGLNAAGGIWNFSTGLAGKTMGVAAGALVVRTTPQALWPADDAPIQGVLELRVADLGVWGPWLPPGWRLSGAMHVGAAIAGRFGAPEYTGQWVGTSIGVRNVLQGVQVQDGNFSIALQGSSARIESFSARAGNGSLNLKGSASLGDEPRAELMLELDRFLLLGRVDRRIVSSGQARLQLGRDSLVLDGELKVDEGLIDFSRSNAPTLSDDVQVVRGRSAPTASEAAETPAAPPKARNIKMDLRVLLGDKLRLRGQGLNTGLRGDLRITAPGGRLHVDGSVQTVDGTYKAYRQNLQIDRGVLTFSGPVDNPLLDIEATRPNLDVRVGVAVTGTVLIPRVRLFSEPPMSDVDKLSWLLRGRASEGTGGADTALLQAAALALASGDEPGALDTILQTIGLDELSLRDSDGTSGGAVVSLGKQLSRNWYIGYERSLNAATGNWQLIYRIARRFTVRMQSGEQNAIALIWTWRWQ